MMDSADSCISNGWYIYIYISGWYISNEFKYIYISNRFKTSLRFYGFSFSGSLVALQLGGRHTDISLSK